MEKATSANNSNKNRIPYKTYGMMVIDATHHI